jgi:hypothetical protein
LIEGEQIIYYYLISIITVQYYFHYSGTLLLIEGEQIIYYYLISIITVQYYFHYSSYLTLVRGGADYILLFDKYNRSLILFSLFK